MEDIIGVIVFILFLLMQGMARSKMKKAQQQKNKPLVIPPRPRVPPTPIEEAELRKARQAKSQPPRPASTKNKKASYQQGVDTVPPPLKDNRTKHAERGIQEIESYQEVRRKAADTEKRTVLTQRDLRQAILWSEVLGQPRAKKRNIR